MGVAVTVKSASDSARPMSGTPGSGEGREARLEALLRAWWHDERPAWTEEGWWDATLDEQVRRLLWLAPGPLLVTALNDLTARGHCPVDHAEDRVLPDWPTPGHAPGWPCSCQIITAAAWDACASWLATRFAASLVDAAGPEPVSFDIAGGRQQIHDPAREELAHALRSTTPAMGNRIGNARALTEHPQLVALIESAAISSWAGRLVLDHLVGLDHQDAEKVITEVCARVQHRLSSGRRPYHSAEVNRVARAARLRVCSESVQQARIRAFASRRVTVHPRGDGMATLIADLSDVAAHRIHRRLTAMAVGLESDAAAEGSTDPRTRDQLRADVMTDLLLGAAEGAFGAGPGATPADQDGPDADAAPTVVRHEAPNAPRPEIQVIVSLDALLSLAEDPAEVPGLGPVSAEAARALACDGAWRAWVTDATGAVTATGTQSYVPSAHLARLIRAREPRCRFPGCHQPAMRCDLDHVIPWPKGPTSAANLGPLCRRHHNLKTHTPWALDPDPPPSDPPPGTTSQAVTTAPATPGWRWRTPAGLTITDGPEPQLPSW
jgi:hypothetical protein